MKVLIVGHGPPTTGGIPTFVTRLADDPLLRARCDRVEFMNTHPPSIKKPGSLNVTNVRLTFVHALAILRRGRHADVIHLNLAATPLLPLLRSTLLSLAGKASGSSVILHTHTGQLEHCLARRSYRVLLGLVLRVVDILVVVSRAAEGALRHLGTDNVHFLENGIDTSSYRVGPNKEDPPLLLFVGTVCERKGLIDLRDALVLLSEERGSPLPVEVAIVGDGEQEGPGTFERIRKAYFEAGLQTIHFRGAIPHDQLLDVLRQASIFCLPSHTEGFPISVLEAMASGAAIIASRVGDIPRMLDEGRAGILIKAGDVRALHAAIDRLITNPSERSQLGSAARQRAEQMYRHDRMVGRLFALYEEAAGRGLSGNRSRRMNRDSWRNRA